MRSIWRPHTPARSRRQSEGTALTSGPATALASMLLLLSTVENDAIPGQATRQGCVPDVLAAVPHGPGGVGLVQTQSVPLVERRHLGQRGFRDDLAGAERPPPAR